jgi:peptidylprolyl isomerase
VGARGKLYPDVQGQSILLERTDELDEIAALEERRSTGDGRLMELLVEGDPRVRLQAAEALGRLPFPTHGNDVTAALCDALEDPVGEVRAAAAFGLGLRKDPASVRVLLAFWNDEDPVVRARLVDAGGRIGNAALRKRVLASLRDAEVAVVMQAAIAPHRWDPELPDAWEANEALVRLLGSGEELHTELVWRALFTLQRRKAEVGRGAYVEHRNSPDARARIFAAKGLAALEPDDKVVVTLVEMSRDPDWRVVAEAVRGLGRARTMGAATAVLDAVEHPSPHVRRIAIGALDGSIEVDRRRSMGALWRGVRDLSSAVRGASVEGLARHLPNKEALGVVRDRAVDPDPLVREGAARGAAHAPGSLQVVLKLVDDPVRRVAQAAIGTLAELDDPEAREVLRRIVLADDRDSGERSVAVTALADDPEPGDLGVLRAAWSAAPQEGELAEELRFTLLEAIARVADGDDGDAKALLMRAAESDPAAWPRQVARRELAERWNVRVPATVPAEPDPTETGSSRVALAGRDFPLWEVNPLVEVLTPFGGMVFELLPAEAPQHVHNFLEHARRGNYDGLNFHRVVPDFVVQGGDPRGDGRGGASWRGDALRHEFTPRATLRGSLGMPRHEDPDSGGAQLFVTHRPTPHLDGRYTIFGILRVGGDVLDRLDVDDRILSVRVLN